MKIILKRLALCFPLLGILVSCSNGASEKDLLGKWNLTSKKISYDIGETWEIKPGVGDWIELLPDGEFKMSEPFFKEDCSKVEGEWRSTADSLFYLVPSRSAFGGELNAKIMECSTSSLILQSTKDNGQIIKFYYSRENQ